MTSHVKEFAAAETASADQFHHHRIATQPSRFYRDRFKRLFDVVLVVLMAPFAVPLVAAFALIIVMTGKSPFFRQRRIGKDGTIFEMLKIRTMVPNAKERLEAHLAADPDARAEWNSTQKLKDDPRITPIGKFLRRSSLDEFAATVERPARRYVHRRAPPHDGRSEAPVSRKGLLRHAPRHYWVVAGF